MLGWITKKLGGSSAKFLFDSHLQKAKQLSKDDQVTIMTMIFMELEDQDSLLTGPTKLQYVSGSENVLYQEARSYQAQERLSFFEWVLQESAGKSDHTHNMYANIMYSLYTAVRANSDEITQHILKQLNSWKRELS